MKELLSGVRSVAEEAAEAILGVYLSDDLRVAVKEDLSPLTQADLASHRHIVAGLKAMTPDLPVLSEESQGIRMMSVATGIPSGWSTHLTVPRSFYAETESSPSISP